MTSQRESQPLGWRLLCSAGAGLALPAALWLVGLLLEHQVICRNQGFSCLGVAFLAIPLAIVGGAGLAYLVLHLLRVEQAWRVALIGPFATWAISSALVGQPLLPLLGAVLGYLAAGVITTDRVAWPWRVALAALLLAVAVLPNLS